MKKIALLIAFGMIMSFASEGIGQKGKSDSLSQINGKSVINQVIPDTLRVQYIDKEQAGKVWYKDNNMPWIIALFISFLGIIVNLIISNQQIRANREATLRQIASSLLTDNRQKWVNTTRETIAELVTQSHLLNIEYQDGNINPERFKSLHEKFLHLISMLVLLLNQKNEQHKLFLNIVNLFMNTLTEHYLNGEAGKHGVNIKFDNVKFKQQADDIIVRGNELLYNEWGKIQSKILET